MVIVKSNVNPARSRRTLYFVGLAFAGLSSLVGYINSAFLVEYHGFDTKSVGMVFAIASFLTLVALLTAPYFYKKFHARKTLIASTLLIIMGLFGVIFAKSTWLAILSFLLFYSLITVAYYFIDLCLEHYSKDNETGSIRGTYLMLQNSAWLLFPFLSAFVHGAGYTLKLVYIAGAVILTVCLFYINSHLVDFKPKKIIPQSFALGMKSFWHKRPLRFSFISLFTLYFFYGIMVVYLPLYLTQDMGISWSDVSKILPIMLLPFVLLSRPYGLFADRTNMEPRYIRIGIGIMSVAIIAMGFVSSGNWMLWAGILLLSRIGASMVETMNESYFFKNIDDSNDSSLAIFRETMPLASLIAPLCASVLLNVFNANLSTVWIFTGGVLLLAIIILSVKSPHKN